MKTVKELIKKMGKETKVKLLPEDVILLLLFAQKDKPIVNRTVLIKEVFLTYKEILGKYGIEFTDPQFFGYKYGPFSYYVSDALWILEKNGLIKRVGRAKCRKEKFEITVKGIEKTKHLLGILPKQIREKLLKEISLKRISWDQWSREGILNYVYKHYHEYAKKSKIKNKKKYMVTVWGQLFEE